MSKAESDGLRVRVAPGLEPAAAAELAGRGLKVIEEPGGVRVPLAKLHEVLLWSRVGSAVTRHMGTVRANKLPEGLASFPWRQVLRRGQRIEVRIVGMPSRGLDRKCQAVIAKRADPRQARGGRAPAAKVLLVNRDGKVEVVITAGEDLWKRGWRRNPGRAPLRECLAAGLIQVAGWDPRTEALVDPMCGSGTFAIEAAHLGLGRAPGAYRSFAAEWWPCFDSTGFERAKKKARASRSRAIRVFGSDRDARQLAAARSNAENARVDRQISLKQCAFEELQPPDGSGLILMNPPYGQRLGASRKTYQFIGGQLRKAWSGWRFGVLLPDITLLGCLPGRPEVATMVRNGGQKVWFAVGRVP